MDTHEIWLYKQTLSHVHGWFHQREEKDVPYTSAKKVHMLLVSCGCKYIEDVLAGHCRGTIVGHQSAEGQRLAQKDIARI